MRKIALWLIVPEPDSVRPVPHLRSAVVLGKGSNTYYAFGPQELAERFNPFFGRQTQELARRHLRKDKACCKGVHSRRHRKIIFALNTS